MVMREPLIRIRLIHALISCLVCVVFLNQAPAQQAETLNIRIKHVYGNAVYLDAGGSSGLSEGQRFGIVRASQEQTASDPRIIAEIEIESVANTSAAGRVISSKETIAPGDKVFLSKENLAQIKRDLSARELLKFAQVASFTEGIPPEQEMREKVPKPPLPEVNRVRGLIGTDYSGLQIPNSRTSAQYGFMLRLDATRLGGTHWNISGYHRARIQSAKDSGRQDTLTDLINRTYHFSINYDNPASRWVAGAGRLYVPWASSLSTIDGFYFGRRIGKETIGIFGGTTPDPSSWNYDANRQLGGVFVNMERGSFEKFRFTSTSGIAISRINWQPDRQFAFFENGIFYKQYVSLYSNVEADLLTAQDTGKREAALTRSYFTLRLQPHRMIGFDINENYFRNVPTFDVRLVGTGLLDKFLFQGLSGGVRLNLPYRIGVFGNAGRSSRSGDQKPSWNYMGGAIISNVLHTGIRTDYRYSRFDSSFGRGIYQSLTLGRDVGDRLRFDLQAGKQVVQSSLTSESRARFINGNIDWFLGPSYFLGVGLTVYRGGEQNYNQYFFNLGYRFDNRRRRRN